MRILVAAGFSESLAGFRLPLLQAMVSAGHEVFTTGPEDDAGVRRRLNEEKVEFTPVPLARAGLNPLSDHRYRNALGRLMNKVRPEGFLAYTHKPVIHGLCAAGSAGILRRAALITGLGYAFTPGGSWRRRVSRRILQFLYARALPRSTALFFQNPDDTETFRQLGLLKGAPAPVIVAGSGVPLDQFPASPVPSGPPVFLMLARLLCDKGVREYTRAAEIVRRSHPEARFLLGGAVDSNPTSISEQELQSWMRAGHIEYLGHVADVRAVLAQCTTYVLPSYREGTPRSVLEALATGRVVVTTDAPGCRETIQDPGGADPAGIRAGTNGYLVPVARADSLAAVFQRICRSPELQTQAGSRSRAYAEKKYDVNLVNATIMEAFQ